MAGNVFDHGLLVEAMRRAHPYFERAWHRDQAGATADINWYYWMLPQRGRNWPSEWRRILDRDGRHSRCEVLRQYLSLVTKNPIFAEVSDSQVIDAANRTRPPIPI